jgi:membrane protease YdiL (CAAX protease family)
LSLVRSLFSLFSIFLASIIIALSEQLLICSVVYTYLSNKFNNLMALLLSSFFYSLILTDLDPIHVLSHSLFGFICIFLYQRSKSLLIPSLFGGFYYAIYIVYIYGWKFHNL